MSEVKCICDEGFGLNLLRCRSSRLSPTYLQRKYPYLQPTPAVEVSGGWIDCRERLPDLEVVVLAWFHTDTGNVRVESCAAYESEDFDDPYWCYSSDGDLAEDITHWQPLPSPPAAKGGESNG